MALSFQRDGGGEREKEREKERENVRVRPQTEVYHQSAVPRAFNSNSDRPSKKRVISFATAILLKECTTRRRRGGKMNVYPGFSRLRWGPDCQNGTSRRASWTSFLLRNGRRK